MENKSYNFEYDYDDVLEYHKRVVLSFDIDSIDSSTKDEHYISYRNLLTLIGESFNEGAMVDANLKFADPTNEVLSYINDILNLAEWQMYTRINSDKSGYDVINYNVKYPYEHEQDVLSVVIPKIDDNIDIVSDIMAKFGYFEAKHTITIDSATDKQWMIVTYNPIESPNLNDYLKDGDKFLRHYSPIRFKENIKNDGLVPNKRADFEMSYPNERLFFIIDSPSKASAKMLKAFADKQSRKGYSREFVCCVVYASELIDKGFVFYKDPNVKDCCYCTRKVDANYIKDFRKVVL